MAITGQLITAEASFGGGTCTLRYGVDLIDDTLGNLGARGFTVSDPAITANVLAYVTQMLPSIEAQVGVPVTLPPATPEPEPEPEPELEPQPAPDPAPEQE